MKNKPILYDALGSDRPVCQQQVLGVDYAYTLQGWLKGVNGIQLDTARDIGNDGSRTLAARDVYAFQLNYYAGDYRPIQGSAAAQSFPVMSTSTASGPNYLFNGNISSMVVNIGVLGQGQLSTYGYDQLNRLISVDVQRAAANWSSFSATQDYREQISYDANGNIQTYQRNGTTAGGKPLAMDHMTYGYNTDASGNKLNNQLRQVRDAVTGASNYTEDIDDQPLGNYRYDAIGNLVADSAERISQIDWSVYGKILSITKRNPAVGEVERISYTYDASGNRISKLVETRQRPDQHTWYVRDAQGNVLAVYTRSGNNTQSPLLLSETHLYGSSRLGLAQRSVNMGQPVATTEAIPLLGSGKGDNFTRGQKLFELSNHLGNVLATVTDRKTGIDTDADGLINHYTADVSTAQDYYAFGMGMPGRKYSTGSYRYGFNGKEEDDEVKGDGNQQDYGMRIYDPRLGMFLSVDPLHSSFPDLTPYQFAGNTPIQAVDLDGGEPQGYREYWESITKEEITRWGFTVQDIFDYETKQFWTVMRYPNTNEIYYYATKYEGANRLFKPANTNLNKSNGEWTGKFIQFKSRSASELGGKSVNAMLGAFAVGVTAPFVAAGAVISATFAVEQATMAALQGILLFYRYGPTVGAAGKVVAEFLDETGSVNNSSKLRNVIDESRLKHIFRNDVGHFIEDTKEARQAIEDVANNASNLLGGDKHGNKWYAWVNEKGQQLWAQVRKGKIVNGGVNETPREYSTETGLAAQEIPRK